ncbi:BrnT family toxin [Magnetospirillum sp. UT-4]|uniref:BrnT family toxin n=1 Tax=Magnetospirillum sp. UT-4 TaxID=2681467 RepID=UPI00138515DA|nr:BrnT family toxin [Magnetospirillum sp. UT-4]CAA7614646.1 conserved hypothetical protein [Magnetospirillum sp. UT-4]
MDKGVAVHWTWDPVKADMNMRKHGVSFDLAARSLGDPLALTLPDPYAAQERWRTIGSPSAAGAVVLLVVHTWPDDGDIPGRIISARVATSHERRAYEEG